MPRINVPNSSLYSSKNKSSKTHTHQKINPKYRGVLGYAILGTILGAVVGVLVLGIDMTDGAFIGGSIGIIIGIAKRPIPR